MAKALENSEQRLAMQALALTAWTDRDPEGAAAALKELPSVPTELQAAYDKAVETSRALAGVSHAVRN